MNIPALENLNSHLQNLVRSFPYGQLFANRKVFGSKIRSDFEIRTYEQNKLSKHFRHGSSLAGACEFVNDFRKYE